MWDVAGWFSRMLVVISYNCFDIISYHFLKRSTSPSQKPFNHLWNADPPVVHFMASTCLFLKSHKLNFKVSWKVDPQPPLQHHLQNCAEVQRSIDQTHTSHVWRLESGATSLWRLYNSMVPLLATPFLLSACIFDRQLSSHTCGSIPFPVPTAYVELGSIPSHESGHLMQLFPMIRALYSNPIDMKMKAKWHQQAFVPNFVYHTLQLIRLPSCLMRWDDPSSSYSIPYRPRCKVTHHLHLTVLNFI